MNIVIQPGNNTDDNKTKLAKLMFGGFAGFVATALVESVVGKLFAKKDKTTTTTES